MSPIVFINCIFIIFNELLLLELSNFPVMKTVVMTLRRRVALELGILVLLATTFLLFLPQRNPWLDVALGGFALLCIGATGRYTRNVIWAAFPPVQADNRFKACVRVTLWLTVPTVAIFLLIGGIVAYHDAGWPAVIERVWNWKIVAVFIPYIGWAFIQQTLFQFYLLGRLLALFPKNQPTWPILITGVGFSLVHLPDVWTCLVTAIAGPMWTFIYYRYRCLLPIAVSHAALGTAFYFGICGHNLAQEWESAAAALRLQ